MQAVRVKDAAATRRRILDAAIAEFAAHGLAGSRMDRIAEAAQCNKAMVYRYFESKDGLFDAVFDDIVVATLDAVPFDVTDLPGYAAALYEQHQRTPEILRIATWDRLERDGAGSKLPDVVSTTDDKLAAIEEAQQQGALPIVFKPAALLRIVLALSQPPLSALDDDGAEHVAAAVRAALSLHA